jgi:hypothetical protein
MHKGSSHEMAALVGLLVGDVEWTSGAWLVGSEQGPMVNS